MGDGKEKKVKEKVFFFFEKKYEKRKNENKKRYLISRTQRGRRRRGGCCRCCCCLSCSSSSSPAAVVVLSSSSSTSTSSLLLVHRLEHLPPQPLLHRQLVPLERQPARRENHPAEHPPECRPREGGPPAEARGDLRDHKGARPSPDVVEHSQQGQGGASVGRVGDV